ncbi:type II toxin-antitoxin system PemK/MazF family toxin [Microbacterium sp. GXF7504]
MPSLLRRILAPFRAAPAPGAAPAPKAAAKRSAPPRSGTETIEVDPRRVPRLTLAYAPTFDGTPDAGEVVWTWVPYAEGDGRGKDRPVLVIAAIDDDRAYAVKLTSKSHDGTREYLPIGPGPWDSAGRPSWVDLDQLYVVHAGGMRREAAALDRARHATVTAELARRHGWRVA